jgi:hypothetical protein
MDIVFELETLLMSYDFRQKLNQSLIDRGMSVRIALITPEGNLVPGDTPGVSPLGGERNDPVQPSFEEDDEHLHR